MEQTLVLIKPDGVRRHLVGKILQRFEERGFEIKALRLIHISQALAERHYAEHKGKSFFNDLVAFITSGPLIATILEGENAVQSVRTMMGSTNPLNAAPGTIRGDFALKMEENIIHGSDSLESAQREIALFWGQHD